MTAPGSIVEALLRWAESDPGRRCLEFEGRSLTYGELVSRSGGWSAGLRGLGVGRADRVALFLENSPEFVCAYLGAQLAGAIVVLVNNQYRQVELRHLLSDSGARVCVTDSAGVGELEKVANDLPSLQHVVVDGMDNVDRVDGPRRGALAGRVPVLGSSPLLGAPPALLAPPPPGDPALIAYTSGTTGRSKGAVLRHENLAANAASVAQAWRWSERDHLLLALPLFHVHGLGVGVHGTLFNGASLTLHRRFDAEAVFDALCRGGPTLFFGVPTMYVRLVDLAQRQQRRPSPLRLYVSGSAPLSVHTFAEFERLFGQKILERYGMSETLMNTTNPYHGERRPGTVGLPFPGQEARVVEVRTRTPVPDGETGEIQVRGPHVFGGYWQRPDATAAAFDPQGWFNTGDLGVRSADGYLTINGRAHELIICGGFNVYPREIEEVLLSHPAVAEAAVVGLPDPEFGEQVAAAVVLKPGAAASAEQLIARCRAQLASFKKPRRVEFVAALPRNAMGKLQKNVLRERLLAGAG
jgi:malonyl-CoA/methylmalonyl-CoA synthetase